MIGIIVITSTTGKDKEMRDRTEQAELDFDMNGERFNFAPDHPSIFDYTPAVADLPPETLKPKDNIVNGKSLEEWINE